MGETFHLRDPSSPSALNPTATTRVPAPASGWSERPRKVQHHLILSLHLSELGGCQPEQPLHCFSPEEQAGMAAMPRSSLHQPTNARAGRQGEMRVAFVAHTATQVLPCRGICQASARQGRANPTGLASVGYCTSLSSRTFQAQPGRTSN